jgi:hypothetical protein
MSTTVFGPAPLPSLAPLLNPVATTTIGPAPVPSIGLLFAFETEPPPVPVPSDETMWSGAMFNGRLFFGQMWANARGTTTPPPDPEDPSPPPASDGWTRIARDTQTWVEL